MLLNQLLKELNVNEYELFEMIENDKKLKSMFYNSILETVNFLDHIKKFLDD